MKIKYPSGLNEAQRKKFRDKVRGHYAKAKSVGEVRQKTGKRQQTTPRGRSRFRKAEMEGARRVRGNFTGKTRI